MYSPSSSPPFFAYDALLRIYREIHVEERYLALLPWRLLFP
jgi:hypothetical protein